MPYEIKMATKTLLQIGNVQEMLAVRKIIKSVMKTHLIRSRGGRRVLYGRGRHRLRCWLLRSRRTHRGSSSCCGGCRQRVDHGHPPELVSAMYIYMITVFEMCFQFRAFIGAMNMMISTQLCAMIRKHGAVI